MSVSEKNVFNKAYVSRTRHQRFIEVSGAWQKDKKVYLFLVLKNVRVLLPDEECLKVYITPTSTTYNIEMLTAD